MARPRRVLRVAGGHRIAPWGFLAREAPILGVPLVERQDRVLARLGLKVDAEVPPAEAGGEPGTLYVDDDVDFSAGALRTWLKRAGPDTALSTVERPTRVGELEVEPQVWLANGALAQAGAPGAVRARVAGVRWGAGTRPVLLPALGASGVAELPGPFGAGQKLEWAIDVRTACTVRHWVHLLRANLAAMGVEVWERLYLRPWSLGYTWLRWPLRRHLAVIGRGCKIHPTAVLDNCVIEDDVEVGAHSVLRGCWVGKGSRIEDHVTAKAGAIGPGAHLGNYSMFNLSVIGARSSVGHIGAQASVIGEDCFVSTFATLHDLNLRGTVRVRWGSELRDSGVPFLGVALGHQVRLGAGVTIASGREVPNGVHIVAAGAVSRLPADMAPGEYIAEGGKLVRDES